MIKQHDNLKYQDFTDYVLRQLEQAGYYCHYDKMSVKLPVEHNSISFSLSNRVNGLSGYYATLTAQELQYQYDNLTDDDITDILQDIDDNKDKDGTQ